MFQDWNTSFIDEIFHPAFVDHLLNRPSDSSPSGPPAVHQLYDGLRRSFPDLTFQVNDIIAEEDRVVVRWTWTCTHLGEFRGIEPTGQQSNVEGIAIYRLVDAQIVERWVSTNLDSLVQKLRSAESM